jgi:hypothetical protein
MSLRKFEVSTAGIWGIQMSQCVEKLLHYFAQLKGFSSKTERACKAMGFRSTSL